MAELLAGLSTELQSQGATSFMGMPTGSGAIKTLTRKTFSTRRYRRFIGTSLEHPPEDRSKRGKRLFSGITRESVRIRATLSTIRFLQQQLERGHSVPRRMAVAQPRR